ncbi:MAG TPA: MMPL family transporter [Solirubrobacterales bacterium]|nr:MMPL family transporter [Solirubrobacterales bacterium]
MSIPRRLGSVAAWAAGHARAVLAVCGLVAALAAVGATQAPTDAGIGTLVDSDTGSYRATQQVRDDFGEEPIVVLAEGDLQRLVLTSNVFRLLRLEGCLSGKVPKGASALPGPCTELAELEPVEFLSGPATFLNEAVVQIETQLRRLAENVPASQLQEYLVAVASRYGITTVPSIDNEEFVATVVFDLSRPRGTPKARLSYLFPNSHSAQIVIRLKPDLSDADRKRAIDLIEAAVAETTPRKACAEGSKPAPCFELKGGNYVVSGAPVVVDGLAAALKDALLLLFAVAIAVMAATLLLVFRSRLRLLPLAVALAAAAIVFGLLALVGGTLTMASIAVLPILIGLAVDYAIQFQARFDEAEESGLSGVEAVRSAASSGGPTIAIACLATAAGFLALLISPTPMIRSFGLLLIAGVLIAFAFSLTAGFAALALRRQKKDGSPGGWRWGGGPPRRAGASSAEHRGGNPSDRPRPPERLLSLAIQRPVAVLTVGAVLAIAGWALGTQIETVSDVRELAPQSIKAVHDLNEVQEATGVSGEVDVSIEAPDLTDPATIEWTAGFKRRVLKANGFSGKDPSCLEAEICPGPALSDFLVRGSEHPTQARIKATLAALSPYALRGVAPLDSTTGEVGHQALISFGIRAQSLDDQQALIDRVRGAIGTPGEPGGPPPGVTVRLAGLPVIAAEAASDLSTSRYWITLAGLLLVALVLLAAYRSLSRALVPLVPTVLATGWASLVLWLTDIPLNPMSAALGALTVAIATEFGVILSARFHEQGGGVEAALRSAYARTGAAVLASGATAVAGFAVLIASEIQMLRDFGVVTVIDLAAALLGVMVVLPAVLSWNEGR